MFPVTPPAPPKARESCIITRAVRNSATSKSTPSWVRRMAQSPESSSKSKLLTHSNRARIDPKKRIRWRTDSKTVSLAGLSAVFCASSSATRSLIESSSF